jgi:Fur family ferric uptake transcriptional regulator
MSEPPTTDPTISDVTLLPWFRRLGWHVTDTRRAILRAAMAMEGFLEADEIVTLTQKFDAGASRATVYRALPKLCKAGLLHKTDTGLGALRYSRSTPGEVPSAEIVIEDCGLILKVPAPFLTWYAEAITAKAGLKLTGQRLQTFARCTHKVAEGDCSQCPQPQTHKNKG